jgi:uncharacterized protein (DUF2147 family)
MRVTTSSGPRGVLELGHAQEEEELMDEHRRAKLAVPLTGAAVAASTVVVAVGLAAVPALGKPAASKVRGTWTDPVGACTSISRHATGR